MNIGEKTRSQNDEYVIKTIKNISEQIHSLDILGKNNHAIDSLNQDAKTLEIKHSIETLVDELDDKNTVPAYDAVSNVKENDTLIVSEKKRENIFAIYNRGLKSLY